MQKYWIKVIIDNYLEKFQFPVTKPEVIIAIITSIGIFLLVKILIIIY